MWILSALTNLIKSRGAITVTEVLPTGFTTVHNIFGAFSCDYSSFKCVTVENLTDAVKPGRYRVTFDMSPRLQYVTPHLAVPDRDAAAGGDAGIRIHKANEPSQLLGCIAPGKVVDGDAVDWSAGPFNELMLLSDPKIETWITVEEKYV